MNNYSPFVMNFFEKYMKTSSMKIVRVKMGSTDFTACYVTIAEICLECFSGNIQNCFGF